MKIYTPRTIIQRLQLIIILFLFLIADYIDMLSRQSRRTEHR